MKREMYDQMAASFRKMMLELVPPEEEVLAAALILEHAEPWLRNEATALGTVSNLPSIVDELWDRSGDVPSMQAVDEALRRRQRLKYKNPFGGFFDGMDDAAFTRAIGALVRGLRSIGS